MTIQLQDYLELPYSELEDLNLAAKEQRMKRVPVEQVREERLKYLTEEKRIKAVTVLFSDLEGRLHMLDYDKKFFIKSWDNLTFDGSSIRGFSAQHESDLRLGIDWPAFYWGPADIFGPGKVLVFGVGLSVFVNHFAEDQHFSGAKDVGRPPVKSGPIDPETQIALMLRGKPANGRTVKGKVVPTFDEKLLVIIEHVQAAFQIAEKHRHGFDSFLLRQILQALFPHLLDGYSLHPLFLGCQVQVFQFAVGKFQVVL